MTQRRILYLASQNKKKLKELQGFLPEAQWDVRLASELDENIDWNESGSTFEDNALIKARVVKALTHHAVLADDSGLSVDALHGAPGVHSARYAGEPTSDARNNEKLLHELRDIPAEKRTARFTCCLAFIDEDNRSQTFLGHCEGKIISEYRGQAGFGYDPLFIPHGHDLTFAELSTSTKSSISHRAQAMKKWLREI